MNIQDMNTASGDLFDFSAIGISEVLSFIAVIVSLLVAYKSHLLTKSIAEAQAKPILTIYTSEYLNEKGLRIENVGVGTAVITQIKIAKGNIQRNTVAELFQFDQSLKWDTFWRFQQTTDYLKAGERRILARLTAENLVRQGFGESEALAILKSWQSQLEGITIEIDYEDVFGNRQRPYKRTFKS
jgi:hypothetical protein